MFSIQENTHKILLRLLITAPLFIVSWILLSAASDGRGSILTLFLGAGLLILGAGILAPPLAQMVANPAGSLFNPTDSLKRQEPHYSMARAKRSKGLYAEALSEYEKITEEFPSDKKAYEEMIDIAIINLKDPERAVEVYTKALQVIHNEKDREMLQRTYEELTTDSVKGGVE